MFVIMACWYNLHKDPTMAKRSIPERMGLTMEQAGVSVTVTSITDILAFGIGAFTVSHLGVKYSLISPLSSCQIMPGLSSFCITAAICIGFIFLLQISWTVAWLSLDQARIERNQHGLIPCITVPHTEQTVDSPLTVLGAKSIHFYSDLFKYWPFKVSEAAQFYVFISI